MEDMDVEARDEEDTGGRQEHRSADWPYMARYNIDPASLRENSHLSQAREEVCVGLVLELNRMREKQGYSWPLFVSWLEQLFTATWPNPAPLKQSILYSMP